MLKKALMALIFCGVAAVIYFQPAVATVGEGLDEQPLYRAFQASKAQPYELNVQAWAKIDDEYHSLADLNQIITNSAAVMGVEGSFTRQPVTDEEMRSVTAIKELKPQEYVVIVAQSLRAGSGKDAGETYLIVNRSRVGNFEKLIDYRQQTKKVFEYLKVGGQVSTYLTGILEGELTAQESNQLIIAMFSAAGIEQPEGIRDKNFVSLSGYNPEIKEYVTVNGRRVNVNIALRYHAGEGNTYVYLGSPLLDGEY